MIIYIWRHGKAETKSDSGKDQDRALAPEGRNEIIDMADFCFGQKGLPKPDKIFASPFLRAKESAEMIQGFLACEKGLEFVPELRSGSSFPEMVEGLKPRVNGLKCIAVVGHIPDLEAFAFGLLDGSGDAEIRLKTGGLVQIEIPALAEPYRGKLLFSLNPEQIPQ